MNFADFIQMKQNLVKQKSYDFAVLVIRMYQKIARKRKAYIISKQFSRSGTSIGALVSESVYVQSKVDFVHKLSIALKEAK